MWSQACDLIDRADRLHRQFFVLAASPRARAVWEPPVDIFEDEREVVIVIALPGVAADGTRATLENGDLVVRAERRKPFANMRCAVRRLEIPYGYFERRIPLSNLRLETASQELNDGCLIVRLRKAENT
jgi:HSP20 family molecular chaperone IbpA